MDGKAFTTDSGVVRYWVDATAGADAPWLVFLPGLTADHTLFDAQMEHFDASFDAAFEDGADLDIDMIYSKNKFTVKSDSLVLRIDADRTDLVHFEEHQGARYAVIELEGSVEINGVPV